MQSKLSQLPWKDFILILWLTSKIDNKARSAVIQASLSLIIKSSVTQCTQKQIIGQYCSVNRKILNTWSSIKQWDSCKQDDNCQTVFKYQCNSKAQSSLKPIFRSIASIFYMEYYACNAIKKCHLSDLGKNTSAHSNQIRKQRFIRNW